MRTTLLLSFALAACDSGEPDARPADVPSGSMARQEPAAGPLPVKLPATPGDATYWYDGERRREIAIDPEVVVEYEPTDESLESIRTALPDAEPVSRSGRARLWRVPASASNGSVVEALAAARPGGHFAPVYLDKPTRAGAVRAVTGRIIVKFAGATSDAEARAWAEERGLAFERRLPLVEPVHVFRTGDDPIEVANEIHESGDVVSAQPDWWKTVVRK